MIVCVCGALYGAGLINGEKARTTTWRNIRGLTRTRRRTVVERRTINAEHNRSERYPTTGRPRSVQPLHGKHGCLKVEIVYRIGI